MTNFLKIFRLKLKMTYVNPYILAKSKGSNISYVIKYLFMIFGIPAISIYFGIYENIYMLTNSPVKYLSFIMLSAILVIVLSGLNTVYSEIFDAQDNELMLTLPIQFKDIFLARLFSCTVSMLFISFIVLLPAFITYTFHIGFNFLFIIYSVIGWLTITFITLNLLAIVFLILTKAFGVYLNKDALTSITMFLGALFYFGYKLIPKTIFTSSSVTSLFDAIFILKPTLLSLTQVNSVSGFLYIILSILICILLTFILIYLSNKIYYTNLLATGGMSKSHNKLFKLHSIKVKHVSISIATIIIKRIQKTPYFFYSMYRSLFIILSICISIYFSINKNLSNGFSIKNLNQTINIVLESPTLYAIFTGLLAFILALLTAIFDTYASGIFSIEGKSYWIQQMAPIKPLEQLLGRLFAIYYFFMAKMILLYVVISIVLNLNPVFLFGFLFFSIILSLPVYLIKMLQDVISPNYEWDNPNTMEVGEKSGMSVMFGIAYSAILAISGYYLIGTAKLSSFIAYYIIISVLATIILCYLIINKLKKY